jgi:hypothetical protein
MNTQEHPSRPASENATRAPHEESPGRYAGPDPGRRQRREAGLIDPRRKSPVLAGLLSLMPGLGQTYVGYYQLGFIHIMVFVTTIFCLANVESVAPLLGPFLGFFVIYNIIDAARRAAYYNYALEGIGDIPLPDTRVGGPGSYIVGGLVLMALGILIFLNTRYGYSLEWLEEWWPIGLVAVGVWLLINGFRRRERSERS